MTIVVFSVFLAALIACLVMGWPVAWALMAGLALFFLLGLSRGHEAKVLLRMALIRGNKTAVVIIIMLLIGAITGLWRASGTIAYCIHYGVRLITPSLFLLLTFALSGVLSYVLGTSFGVISTIGVILMALARFGGVNELMTAGAVISGAYVGDRGSPASSSACLVATVTDTQLYRNVRQMRRTGLLPLLAAAAFHGVLSVLCPLQSVDEGLTRSLTDSFVLSWPAAVPALLMLVLPLVHVPIRTTMLASSAAAAAVAVAVQGLTPGQVLRAAFLGYQTEGPLGAILSGGGVGSMVYTCFVLWLTCLYSGILEEIDVLEPLERRVLAVARRFGRFPAALLTAVMSVVLFCNQSIAIMLSEQLLRRGYANREELAMDIENSSVLIAGLIPWSIASSAPRAMLGVGPGASLYAALLWMIPLLYLPTKRLFYGRDREAPVPRAEGGAD